MTCWNCPSSRAHKSNHNRPHPLDGVNVLICGGIGQGLQHRLKQKGILGVSTSETDPERAVASWLDGTLPETAADDHAHAHGHDHHDSRHHAAHHSIVELTLPH